jgi:hypothetical protein
LKQPGQKNKLPLPQLLLLMQPTKLLVMVTKEPKELPLKYLHSQNLSHKKKLES